MKELKLTGLLGAALLILTACGTSQVTASALWLERFAYFLQKPSASVLWWKYRCRDNRLYHCHPTVLLPLFQYQMNSTRKMVKFNPSSRNCKLSILGSDLDSRTKLSEDAGPLHSEKRRQNVFSLPSF